MKRLLLILVAIGLLCTLMVDARSVEWRHDSYSLFASSQDLQDTLRDFCAAQGVSAVISPGVAGKVSGRFEDMPPAEFLDLLAQTYALSWYYDGHVLYVYRADEVQSRMLSLDHVHPERLKATLSRLALWDERFAWRTVDDEGLIHVSGPPRLIQLVEETALFLEGRAAQELRATEEVRVFPLRHAWADDLTLSFLKREVTVPGVVSTLRTIMTEQGGSAGRTSRRLPATATGLRGTGMAAMNRDGAAEPAPVQGGEAPSPVEDASTALAAGQGIQARIMADTRLNAVVVRDAREKMPLYESLIQELDVAVHVIEIQAAIIDVNVDFTRDLGVNWRFGARTDGGMLTAGGLGVDSDFTAGNMDALVEGGGLNLSTLYSTNVSQLLTRIHALETQGNAQILSRPTVLTLDNVEAHIEHTRTLHIRLTGEREVDLFKVDTGTVLEVTPRIIEEEGRRRIKLLVSIRDGSYNYLEQVDDIPEVQESAINTQAVMELGQSLLLGGFYLQQTRDSQDGIPLLMHLPLLGHAFKTSKKVEQTRERLFLITPRVVDMDAGRGQPLGPEVIQDGVQERADVEQYFSSAPPGRPAPAVPIRRGGCAPVRSGSGAAEPILEQSRAPADVSAKPVSGYRAAS